MKDFGLFILLAVSLAILSWAHVQTRADLAALDEEVGALAKEVSQLRGLVRVCCAP